MKPGDGRCALRARERLLMRLHLEDYGTGSNAFARLAVQLDPDAANTLMTTMRAILGHVRLDADERAALVTKLREMGDGTELAHLERALASRGAS